MFKKSGLLLVLLLSFTFIFAGLTVNVDSQEVLVGKTLPIEITTDQSTITHLYVEVLNGGFDDPFILFDGINLQGGQAKIVFLAPLISGESKITFYNEDRSVEKELKLNIIDEATEKPKTSLEILEKKGNVLYKKPNEEIWDTLKSDQNIEENSEIITLKDGLLVLKESNNDIEINVSPETQLFITKLRSTESGDIDIQYELKKGATVNKIDEILAPGSKYIVSSGSVVAGVRGTKFGFEKIGETTKVRTFEGTVFTSVNGQLFPITANNMLTYNQGVQPNIKGIDKNLEDYERDNEPEEPENNTEEPENNTEKTQTTSEPIAPAPTEVSASIGEITFGKQQKKDDSYLVYSLAPEFDFGSFGFGIGFNAYQTEIDSPLYYGIPTQSASPSEDLWSAFSVNYLKLDLPSFYLRYGNSPAYTKGLGLFMNNYYIPYSRVLDTELRFANVKVGAHVPYEVNSFVPFIYSQPSDVFFGYADLGLGIFNTEVTGVFNLGEEIPNNEFSQAYLATFYRDILFFRLGVEGDLVLTESGSMTYGALAGPTFNLPPYFQFMFGLNYLSDGFNMEYLNPYYEYNVAKDIYMDLDKENSFGLIGKVILNIDPYLNTIFNYNKPLNESRDSLLKGDVSLNLPEMGSFPKLNANFTYIQYKFLEDNTVDNVFLNKNTSLSGYIYYPVLEGSGVVYSVNYDMSENEFKYSLSFESRGF
jgi:hypothetical protein